MMFGRKIQVSTDEVKIQEILNRSVAAILPSKEELQKQLLQGQRLKFYIGADATGPELHLGHATNFMLVEKIRKLGHEVVILFGDFTAMIGDPSGKDSARKQLTKKDVEKNIKSWKKQVSKIVSFSGYNRARIVKNSTWLSRLSFSEILKICSHFTVQQMVERDMFEKRIGEGKPVFLHEFMYPLMQGYDSVAMNVDVEVGGNDQTFNMLAGRTLQKIYNNKEKFVIATTLLVNPKTGKKLMSKSEGGYVALSDEPQVMYGKIMALPDEVIIPMFVDCTYVSLEDIESLKASLTQGVNPRDIKMRLAKEIVGIYHSKTSADKAEQSFVQTFQKKQVPRDIPEIVIGAGEDIVTLLIQKGFISSKTELRRLAAAGAITEILTNKKVEAEGVGEIKNGTYKIGKHRFVKISTK